MHEYVHIYMCIYSVQIHIVYIHTYTYTYTQKHTRKQANTCVRRVRREVTLVLASKTSCCSLLRKTFHDKNLKRQPYGDFK